MPGVIEEYETVRAFVRQLPIANGFISCQKSKAFEFFSHFVQGVNTLDTRGFLFISRGH